MTIVTHALLPVNLCLALETGLRLRREDSIFTGRILVLVALCGALPDILSPHLSLEARLSSWTHNIWFFLGFAALALVLAAVTSRSGRWSAAVSCACAVGLHLLCDGVAGGIRPLHPLGGERWGEYFVHWRYWFVLDGINLATLSVLLAARILRMNRARDLGCGEGSRGILT
jgi:membrane-bound metal-dependent hydrolase YbcI (DUF457 family)